MSNFLNDSIFWIEVNKIRPNPYQPRREFDQDALHSLADSIRQYGVLQALVVTRKEEEKEDGGIIVYYELIAGERRLRASRLAGLQQIPALIKTGEENNQLKLELAIIENVQREDLNPIDRAKAFFQLASEFGFKHGQIGKKVGRSREYVSNTIRMLSLPEEVQQALGKGKITEGHTRPIMMLIDRPEEQMTLFKEIMFKKLTVRDAEAIARRIAYDKVRKNKLAQDPELLEIEERLAETLGTRVRIEPKDQGGRVQIDFFSSDDLKSLLDLMQSNKKRRVTEVLEKFEQAAQSNISVDISKPIEKEIPEQEGVIQENSDAVHGDTVSDNNNISEVEAEAEAEIEKANESENDDGLYSISSFSL